MGSKNKADLIELNNGFTLGGNNTTPATETGAISMYVKQSPITSNNEFFMLNQDGVEIQLTWFGFPTFKTAERPTYVTYSGDNSISIDDHMVFGNAAGLQQLELPYVSQAIGKSYYIKYIGAHTHLELTNADASDIIDGALTLNILANHCYYIISDGVQWRILAHYVPA